jgi:argininosuccinate lyase
VTVCESEGLGLAALSLERLKSACDVIEPDVFDVLGARNAVAVLTSYGSGGRGPVLEQLARWRAKLGMHA